MCGLETAQAGEVPVGTPQWVRAASASREPQGLLGTMEEKCPQGGVQEASPVRPLLQEGAAWPRSLGLGGPLGATHVRVGAARGPSIQGSWGIRPHRPCNSSLGCKGLTQIRRTLAPRRATCHPHLRGGHIHCSSLSSPRNACCSSDSRPVGPRPWG